MDNQPSQTSSSLEKEIIEKAQKPFYDSFKTDSVNGYFKIMLTMKTQISYHTKSKSKPEYELAILNRRFIYNAMRLLESIPITMQTDLKPKTAFLIT